MGSEGTKIIRYSKDSVYYHLDQGTKQVALPNNFTGVIEVIEQSNGILMTEYWCNGNLHREDGPAVIFHDTGLKEYFLNGIFVTAEEVFDRLTPEQQEKEIWRINEWR